MKNRNFLLAVGFSMLFTTAAFSQVRNYLIFDYNAQQRDTLVTLMQEYIDTTIIGYHCDFQSQANDPNLYIHSDFDFLPFHRTYLEALEDFLYLKGHPEFVPLPKWNPSLPTPIAFQVVDVDCKNKLRCITSGFSNDTSNCGIPSNWDPQIYRPSSLELPDNGGVNLCDWIFTPTSSATTTNCCPSGLSRAIEGNALSDFYHNSVHGSMRGVMGNFRSPAAPIFWPWHGYVDDIWREWECHCPSSTTAEVDLYMKDNHKVMESWRDRGEEPSFDPNNLIYLSEDIWVRRDSSSGFETDEHEPPQYDTNLSTPTRAYVYVRVRNRGCVASLGTEELALHWSKAFLAGVSWPDGWNGMMTQTTPPLLMGDMIETTTIPSIPAGGQTILRFEWELPDPRDYHSESTDPWHFCLLGRILAENDTMAVAEGPSVATNTVNNNNIVWKNVSVIPVDEVDMQAPGAVVAVGNLFSNEQADVYLEFLTEENTPPITDFAEVSITLDEELFQVWTNGGRNGEGIDLISEDERSILIKENGAKLYGLSFEPFQWGTMKVAFNFFIDNFGENPEYKFHVVQKNSLNDQLTGGELYQVKINTDRDLFDAQSSHDNLIISKTDTALLSASSIGEPAIYEWYNSKGELIDTGMSIQVAPLLSQEYKLRTIAKADGFVDYDAVQVDVLYNSIKSIAPNPASGQVKISYDAKNATTAVLKIQAAYGSASYFYKLNTNQNTINIDVSNYPYGIYTVLLIHDGVIMDSKQLSIL